MTAAWAIRLGVLSGSMLLSLIMVVIAARLGVDRVLVLALVLPAAGILLLHPILPLFLLVIFVPLDALANRLFSVVPTSPSAALTAAAIAALVIRLPQQSAAIRFGLNEAFIRWLLLFVLAAIISMIFADNRELAHEAMSRFSGMIILVLLIVLVVDRQWHIRLLVLGLVGATLFSGSIVIVDTMLGIRLLSTEVAAVTAEWEGMARSAGASDYNPTTAALMTGTGSLLALVLLAEWPKYRIFSLATVLVGTISIILSFARSASITFVLTSLLWSWKYRRGRLFPLAMSVSLMAVAAALPLVPDLYWERMGTLLNFNSDYTLWRRLGYNLIGLDLLYENPVLGVGPGNFPYHYLSDDYRFIPGRTLLSRDLHNMYLGMAVEFGLLGLAPFLAMIWIGMAGLNKAMHKNLSVESRAFSTALFFTSVGYLIGSLFLPNQYYKITWILIGLNFAQARLACNAAPSHPTLPGDDDASGGDRQ